MCGSSSYFPFNDRLVRNVHSYDPFSSELVSRLDSLPYLPETIHNSHCTMNHSCGRGSLVVRLSICDLKIVGSGPTAVCFQTRHFISNASLYPGADWGPVRGTCGMALISDAMPHVCVGERVTPMNRGNVCEAHLDVVKCAI